MSNKQFYVSTFYLFKPIADLNSTQAQIESWGETNQIKGLFIIANEGINSTFSAPSEDALNSAENYFKTLFNSEQINFKHSFSEKQPFRILKVKQRPEIVTLNTPHLVPQNEKGHHLTPTEWNDVLKNEKDILLIDTRNWYETHLGKFKNAIDPNIEVFTDFPNYIKDQDIPKDKKILMYCTGGIRCEKGQLELNKMGYENVYQLDGGILKYIEEYPNDEFDGECFVFDHRVAVDQNLQVTTKYKLCPHTGQPGTIEIICVRCDSPALLAKEIKDDPIKSITCSKNCAYHWSARPGKKGPKQILEFKQ